jgi:hypothetical protein
VEEKRRVEYLKHEYLNRGVSANRNVSFIIPVVVSLSLIMGMQSVCPKVLNALIT